MNIVVYGQNVLQKRRKNMARKTLFKEVEGCANQSQVG